MTQPVRYYATKPHGGRHVVYPVRGATPSFPRTSAGIQAAMDYARRAPSEPVATFPDGRSGFRDAMALCGKLNANIAVECAPTAAA